MYAYLAVGKLLSLLDVLLRPDASQEPGLCDDGLPTCRRFHIMSADRISIGASAHGKGEPVDRPTLPCSCTLPKARMGPMDFRI